MEDAGALAAGVALAGVLAWLLVFAGVTFFTGLSSTAAVSGVSTMVTVAGFVFDGVLALDAGVFVIRTFGISFSTFPIPFGEIFVSGTGFIFNSFLVGGFCFLDLSPELATVDFSAMVGRTIGVFTFGAGVKVTGLLLFLEGLAAGVFSTDAVVKGIGVFWLLADLGVEVFTSGAGVEVGVILLEVGISEAGVLVAVFSFVLATKDLLAGVFASFNDFFSAFTTLDLVELFSATRVVILGVSFDSFSGFPATVDSFAECFADLTRDLSLISSSAFLFFLFGFGSISVFGATSSLGGSDWLGNSLFDLA